MKIFIVYASAGSGHFRAAQALYNYFKRNNPNLEIRLIDTLAYSPKLFKSGYINGYALMINYAHYLWAACFYISGIKFFQPIIKQIAYLVNRLNTLKFAQFLLKENPDFIISTHFLSSEVISYLKKKSKINSQLITVITDFGVHPFWLSDGTDIYIVASEFSRQQLMREGIEEAKIKVLGIPIEQKFLARFQRHILLKNFNLQDKFTVLVVTGSFGIGPIERIVDLLYRDVQVLVVCARNKALFNRLKRKNYPNVLAFSFVNNIEELMAISDIIITKPGGLTIAEALAMELAPIFISAIPGQEAANIEILARYNIGLGISIKDLDAIKGAVLAYKDHPDKLNAMRENMRRIRKPDVLRQIYNVICPDSVWDTG